MMERPYHARWRITFLFLMIEGWCACLTEKEYILQNVNNVEAYLADHPITEDILEAYIALSEEGIAKCGDVKFGLKISQKAKKTIENFTIQQTGMSLWELEKFSFEHKTWFEMLDKNYDLLKLEAQNKVFDSYLLYLEKKREPCERFYMPKRKQFHKFGLIEGYQGMLDDLYDILCISMIPGSGKALSVNELVLTPEGFVRNGDLKVGDKVISGRGTVSTILGVYPQGKLPVYEVVFDDGSKSVCSEDHLWTVQTRDDRNKKRSHKGEKRRTITLKDITKNIRVENGKRLNYSIDYVPVIDCFESKILLIHPYVLGVLIGDGSFSSGNIRLTTPDKEILDKVNGLLPEGYHFKFLSRYDYFLKGNSVVCRKRRNLIRYYLEKYGLNGKHSYEKFIPKDYLTASYNDRLELLKGLLDTDGHAETRCIEYSTSSEQLAKDVVELVHSVGGYASLNTKEKTEYRDKDGNFVRCRKSYRVIIQFSSNQPNPFYLSRKRNVYKPKRKELKRFIKEVRYAGEEECQCIYIDDPSHLYITNDYIITHNTTLLKFFNSAVVGWFPKDYNLFYSHSGDITRMYYDGVLQMVTDNIEYAWHDIFPDITVTSTNAKMQQFNVGKYKPFPSLQTAAVGSENAGKVRASKFLLVDDMIGKLEEALNKNILEKLWGAYTVDARQRKTMDSDNNPCKEVIQATRWSTMDPIGRIIRMYEGNDRVKVISMPDIDPVTGESNFDYEFGGFTVDFFHDQALLMDEISYKCLYKQEPIEREGLVFPEDKIRRYLNLPHGEPEIITAQCDTKGKGTDYFVLPVLAKYGDDYYCIDCVCDNTADYELQYENASNVLVNNEVQECEFERNAGGDRVAMEVNKRVESKGWVCNITDVPTETNKEARIYQFSAWILQHVIFKDKSLYTAKEPYGIMMNLLMQYSVSSAKQLDDVPDVFSNFAKRIVKGSRTAKAEAVMNPFRTGGWF